MTIDPDKQDGQSAEIGSQDHEQQPCDHLFNLDGVCLKGCGFRI